MLRFILLLIEQAPLLSALIGSALAYLVSLKSLDLKSIPFDWLEKPLKKWVEFRQGLEEKFPQAIVVVKDLITFVSIYLFVPLFDYIFTLIIALWNWLVVQNSSIGLFSIETVRIGALIFIFIISFALFWLRKKSQLHYAYIEFIVGVAMIKDALEMFHDNIKTFALPDALKFFAAIYVIIRAFVNRDEAKAKKSENK